MRALSSSEIVALWDESARCPRSRLGALLLAPVFPDRTQGELLSLTIGESNEWLFRLHRQLAGELLDLVVDCPQCGQRLEFAMNSSALVPDDAGQRRESETLLEYQGYRILLRPLSLRDLAAIREQETLEAVTGQLLRRAVVTASVQVEDLPEAVLAEIAEQMPVLDPHSELRLSLTCPDCGRKWISLIDIAALVKDEIAACAGKVMEEVHVLATAYGWSEQEILALHPKRRSSYLRMVS